MNTKGIGKSFSNRFFVYIFFFEKYEVRLLEDILQEKETIISQYRDEFSAKITKKLS